MRNWTCAPYGRVFQLVLSMYTMRFFETRDNNLSCLVLIKDMNVLAGDWGGGLG